MRRLEEIEGLLKHISSPPWTAKQCHWGIEIWAGATILGSFRWDQTGLDAALKNGRFIALAPQIIHDLITQLRACRETTSHHEIALLVLRDYDMYEEAEKLKVRLEGENVCHACCGDLSWTVKRWGVLVHKEACPSRTTPYHQGNPPSLEGEKG